MLSLDSSLRTCLSLIYISKFVVRGNAAYGLPEVVPTGDYVFLFIRNLRDNSAFLFDSVVFYYMTDTYGVLRALDVSRWVLTPMQ